MRSQTLEVKTAEQLQLPRPQIHGGGPEIIKSPKIPALDRIIKPWRDAPISLLNTRSARRWTTAFGMYPDERKV